MKTLIRLIATALLVAFSGIAAMAASSPHQLLTLDPLTQPAPKLARPLRVEADDAPTPDAKIVPLLWKKRLKAEPGGLIKVIVLLHEPLLSDLAARLVEPDQLDDLRAQHLVALEQGFAAEASVKGFSPTAGLSHLPIVFGEIQASQLVELAKLPTVKAIEEEHEYHVSDAEGGALTKGTQLRTQFGASGAGIGVAVLDTGIDLNQVEFTGRIVAQANELGGVTGQDDEGHGTSVAGVIGGSTLGMAPQARLWAVKVLDSAGHATSQSVLSGLNAVYASRNQFGGVRVINLSLGGGGPFNTNCDAAFPADAAAVNQLVAAGISVFAASGNDGFVAGVEEPACLSNTVAVGAVYDANVGSLSFLPPGVAPTIRRPRTRSPAIPTLVCRWTFWRLRIVRQPRNLAVEQIRVLEERQQPLPMSPGLLPRYCL
jgi:hypothetical protein